MADNLQPEATAPTGTGPRGDVPIKQGVDYRQVQQPYELRQPWHIPVSGAETEAQELAQALKGFGKEATGIGDKLNAKAGSEAGRAAGLDPGFQPKTGLAAVTAFGANYNAAAHVSYVANTQTSIESAIDQAEQAYPHDPLAFAAHVQQVRDATLKETPALYQPEVQTMFDRRIEAGHNRIAEATIKQGQQDGVAAYTGTMESRLKTAVRTAADLPGDKATATIQQAMHDNATMADGLVASGAISKERAETLKTEFKDKITEEVHTHHAESVAGNWVSTARTTQDITSGDRALAQYVADPANSNEDKARVGAEYARQREQFEHQQGILHAPDVQALASYIEQVPGEKEGRGGFGPAVLARIDDMRTKGWITTEYARSLSDRAALNSAKGQNDDKDTYNVNRVWNGDDPKFDPKDPKAAKAVDTFFKTVTAANGFARGTTGYEDLAVSTMQHTSVVPPTIRRGLIADLASGDPLRAAQAARLQERLYVANPGADIYQEDTKSEAVGDILQRNLDAGMPPQQAYEMARNQIDVPKDVQEQRKLEYSNAVRTATDRNPKMANADMLQSKLVDSHIAGKGIIFDNPTPPTSPTMRAEYEGLVQEFYTRTGKIDQAQDLAFKQMQKSWALTSVNGAPEFMKWGPSAAETPIIREGIAQTMHALYGTSSLNTSKYVVPANDASANPANWDKRADGTTKGQGFLGLLKRPDGRVSSEISIGVEINGKETEIPTLVPTLSQKQLDYLINNPVDEKHPIPKDIVQTATEYARQRVASGKSPFAGAGEQVRSAAPGSGEDPSTVKLVPFGGTNLTQGRLWNLQRADGTTIRDAKNDPITLDAARGRPLYEDRLKKQQAADKAADLDKGRRAREIIPEVRESLAAGSAAGG